MRARPAGGSYEHRAKERLRMQHSLGALLLACSLFATVSSYALAEEYEGSILWQEPADIASRNLLYGSGGEQHQPDGTMVFIDEDHAGTTPKLHLRDQDGTKWTAKMGVEAKPETAAAHLLWAVGYFTDEDYLVSPLGVEGLPSHLQRGQNLVRSDGMIQNVRLKRHLKGSKKIGNWKWKHNHLAVLEDSMDCGL